MDTIKTIEKMVKALEHFEAYPSEREMRDQAVQAGQKLIEELSKQEGEPVAEDKVKQLVKQCTHRDVDGNWYVDGVQLVHATCFALDAIMCRNTTPQQRKPLELSQMVRLTYDIDEDNPATQQELYNLIRKVEAAHGIKEKP